VSDNETLESILAFEGVPVDIEINDLLVEDLYSKERGVRVLFFGIQLDCASQTKCGHSFKIRRISNGYGWL
jgi:hypothetical protein